MQFIEALKLRSKLFLLFILITMGLLAIGVMGALNINAMKKNIDALYFGTLIPVTELNEIIQLYRGDLTTVIYKTKNSEISQSQAISKIDNSLMKISQHWKSYESHFKKDNELEYVEYTALEIQMTHNYFMKILKAGMAGEDLRKISTASLEKNTAHINAIIQKLVNYEVEIAKYERKMFLQKYDQLFNEVLTILIFVVLGVLFISFYVFKSIQNDHTKLEIATSKLKRANKKLENVSYTDALTSLHNRRYFNVVYDRELKRAKRTHSYITFMMLDVDFFKQFNDTYGHIEGDSALRSVASVLQDTLKRPGDFVFRLGGEEFGVLLTNTDPQNSSALAQTICDAIKAKQIEHKTSKVNDFLTISIGLVCCIADDALNEELFISRADAMLYKAKEEGRDRYVLGTDISDAKTKVAEESSQNTTEEEKLQENTSISNEIATTAFLKKLDKFSA